MLHLDPFTLATIRELASAESARILITMPATPMSQDNQKMRTQFGNLAHEGISVARESVSRETLTAIEQHLEALADNYEFWNHQAYGLIVTSANDRIETYRVPVELPARAQAGAHLDVTSLFAAANETGVWILAITDEEATLFRYGRDKAFEEIRVDAMPNGITDGLSDILVRDVTPSDRLDDAEGYRQRQVRYLRAIDAAITPIIRDSGNPLVLVTTVEHAGEFDKLCDYPLLSDEHLLRSPSDTPMDTIRSGLEPIIDRLGEQAKQGWLDTLEQRRSANRVAQGESDLMAAAKAGQIEYLFVPPQEEGSSKQFAAIVRAAFKTGAEILPMTEGGAVMDTAAGPMATLRWAD